MNFKLIIFLFLLAGILISFGCSKKTDAEDIKNKLIEANTNLNSYTVEMMVSVDIIENTGKKTVDKIYINSTSNVDRINRKVAVRGTIKEYILGIPRYFSETETYVIDNHAYTNTYKGWLKMKLDKDTQNEYDQINQVIELIKSGTIKLLGNETIGGNSYYVVKINPDLRKIAELALKGREQSGLFKAGTEFKSTINSYAQIVWINKNTFIIENAITNMKMVVTEKDIDRKGKEIDRVTNVGYIDEVKISNVNEEFNISLPVEAKEAVDIIKLGELNER